MPKSIVFVDGIADGRLAFNCFAHVSGARKAYSTRGAVLLELFDRLRNDGIEIGTMPQRLDLIAAAKDPGVRARYQS